MTINGVVDHYKMYGLKRQDSVILTIDKDETANGTWIKKHKLLPDRELLLKVGDTIGIGCKAGENSSCTFEVVLIQIDNDNKTESCVKSQNLEETREIVHSTTDNLSKKDDDQIETCRIREIPSSREVGEKTSDISSTSRISNEIGDNPDTNKTPSKLRSETSRDPCKTSARLVCSNSYEKWNAKPREDESFSPYSKPSNNSDIKVADRELCERPVHVIIEKSETVLPTPTSEEERDVFIVDSDEAVECIDLSGISEDETANDIKPILTAGTEYSTVDEIVILDSDDEDFPRSQLNTTHVNEVPDYSSMFQSMYKEEDFVIRSASTSLHGTENTWFESVSQSNLLPMKKLIVDLPMISYQGKSKKSDRKISIRDKERSKKVDGMSTSSSKKECVIDENEKQASPIDLLSDTESTSVSSPKRPISDDDVDNSIKPSKKKLSIERSSEECNSNESGNASSHSFSPSKEKLLPCWVVLSPVPNTSKKKRKSDEFEENVAKKQESEVCSSKIQHPAEPKVRTEEKKHTPTIPAHDLSVSSDAKKLVKKIRKERLQQLAAKRRTSDPRYKSESVGGPVVMKVTQKNRSAYLMDSMCINDDKTISESMTDVKSFHTFRGNESVPEIMKNSGRVEELYDSLLDDALDLNSQTMGTSSSAPTIDSVQENVIRESGKEFKSPPKRIAHKKSVSSEKSRSSSKRHKNHESSSSKDRRKEHLSASKESSKKERSSEKMNKPSTESKLITFDIFALDRESDDVTSPMSETVEYKRDDNKTKQKGKAEMKLPFSDGFTKITKNKKRVQFYEGVPEYSFFTSDPEERRNNGIFAPRYKLNESLIKEELFEFETAVSIACKWSVKWLEEQKKILKPPPNLYNPFNNNSKVEALVEYKEKLKEEMFLNLWRAIFDSYNKPDQDFLPHTQYLIEGNKNGLYTLTIESVDISRTASLWTIYAYRDIDEYSVKDELINGQMVVINFYVIRKINPIPHKTMVFAYVASVNQMKTIDETNRQKVVLKIFQKDFEIMPGEIKIKVLTYTKTYLRPFQALAMILRSPLTNLLISRNSGSMIEPLIHTDDSFQEAFLDPTQRSAINMCLNCISSPKPSICLVDGPPGCGKSQVIVSLLHELFSERRRRMFPDDLKVLVISSSDNIADDLAYRLEKRDSKKCTMTLLRYGNCKNMHHKIKHCSLDEKIRKLIENDENNSLVNLEEEKRNLLARKNSIQLVLESPSATLEKKAEANLKLAATIGEYDDLMRYDSRIKYQLQGQAAKDQALVKADVIITSVSSCWSSPFECDFVPSQYNKGDVHKFTVCIFDDANDVEEIHMLIPIMLMVRSLILVGDSKNIYRFKEESRSPFLRLVRDLEQEGSNALTKLNMQHRMLPEISKWLTEYYCLNFQPKQSYTRTSLTPISVIHLKEDSEKCHYSEKWEKQVTFCCHLLQKIIEIEKNDQPITVIVVTEGQKEFFKNKTQSLRINPHKVRVCTTEDICGRENEIVVLCLPVKRIDINRWLYVASSRARSSLFICGYFTVLQNDSSVQWMLATAGINKYIYECDVNDPNVSESILRFH